MIRRGIALFATGIAACALAGTAKLGPESWEACHCDWLEQETRAIAGPDMVECGFVNLLEDTSKQEFQDGMRCARQAFENSMAFRYGSLRIPIDSYAREILIRSGDGTVWLVTHDLMVDGSAAQLWQQRCKQLRFKSRNAGFVVSDCETHDEAAP